jgi:hypothetical protein
LFLGEDDESSQKIINFYHHSISGNYGSSLRFKNAELFLPHPFLIPKTKEN